MDKYLQEAPDNETGKGGDYPLVDAPLLDYLVTETEGPTRWKYPKL